MVAYTAPRVPLRITSAPRRISVSLMPGAGVAAVVVPPGAAVPTTVALGEPVAAVPVPAGVSSSSPPQAAARPTRSTVAKNATGRRQVQGDKRTGGVTLRP